MSYRETLTKLAKHVAREIAAGKVGLESVASWDILETYPNAVLLLVELAQKAANKKRLNIHLITAYTFLIGRSLELLRHHIERDHVWALELVAAVREQLLILGKSGLIGAPLMLNILNEFVEAQLDPGSDLRDLVEELIEEDGQWHGDNLIEGSFDESFGHILEEAGGTEYDVLQLVQEFCKALPADQQMTMIYGLLRSPSSRLREAGVFGLLDRLPEVRVGVAAMVDELASASLMSGVFLRRMITMRNWLPEDERPALDKAVRSLRLKGVQCAQWTPQAIEQVFASPLDGAGCQSLLVLVKDGRRHGLAALLIKQGEGIRDAWVRRAMLKREVDALLRQARGAVEFIPVDVGYLRRVLPHVLAQGVASGMIPPAGLLEVVESLGLVDLQPRLTSTEELLEVLTSEPVSPPPAAETTETSDATSPFSLAGFHFLESWFEDDAAVDELLSRRARLGHAKKVALVLDSLIEPRRSKWAGYFAWMAFLFRCEEAAAAPWADMAQVARDLLAGRPAASLPLMMDVAERTVDAAHRRKHNLP